MYKKILAGAAAFIMIMGASVCPVMSAVDYWGISANAEVMKNNGTFYYQVIRGGSEVEILSLVNANAETATIPSKIDGLPVTSIASEAFYNKNHTKTNYLKSVTLPDTIIEIKNSAFAYNGNLTKIIIPKSVKSIGASAFEGCKNLKTIDLPDSLISIGDKAFYWCEKLASITLPP